MNELLGEIVVIKRNGADGPHFPLRTNECLFGRKPECDIRIQLPNVSQEHAIIRVDNDKKIKLINLSSGNKTLVNGKPIETVDVQHLDVFTISDRSFRFEFPSPVKKAVKSPIKSHRRRSSTSLNPEQENRTPKMPTPKGSPRTPPTGGSLKESIHRLRRHSMPLQEEEEAMASPAAKKTPFSIKAVNLQALEQDIGMQEVTEEVLKQGKSVGEGKNQRSSKRVSFGPVLSPEHFDKTLPPATPVRRGATPKRSSVSVEAVAPEIPSAKKRRSVAATPQAAPIAEEEDVESLEGEDEVAPESGTPKGRRRSSSRLAAKSPNLFESEPESSGEGDDLNAQVQSPKTACLDDGVVADATADDDDDGVVADDDEEQDKTADLDSDDYTSDEESALEQASTKVQSKLATPVRDEIKKGIELRETKKKLATPVGQEIKDGVELRKTKKKLATPVRKEIKDGVELRKTKKKLATPVRQEIKDGVELRKTKKKLATPVRKEIKDGVELRKTKKKLATPVRQEIVEGIELRKTKKKLATPVRIEIKEGVELRKTKRSMPTPLKKEINAGVELQQTKKKLSTPVKMAIQGGVALKATKKKMATPIRAEIKSKPKLRQTKKAMDSAIQAQIQQGVILKKTKQTMALELQIEIIKGTKLQQTVKRMPTPLKKAIADGVTLRKTKKSLPTPVKAEISRGATLRKTKKSLPTPVKRQIKEGSELKQTKKKMATPMRQAIHDGISLKSTKRKRSDAELCEKAPKKLKTSPTADFMEETEEQQIEQVSKRRALKTPLRKAIASGLRLNPLRRRMATPLRKMIHSKPTLRVVRKKSSAAGVLKKPTPRKPTYAEIVKRKRKSIKGPAFKFGKTAQQFAKVASAPPAKLAVPVTCKPETPKSPVAPRQERRKSTRKSTSNQDKKLPLMETARVTKNPRGVSEKIAPPLAESAKQKSSWMSSLARAANGPKTRHMPLDDFEGMPEMFTTPPAVEARASRSSKPKKAGNWLSSLAIATNGPRKHGAPVEDFQGVADMFATPPSEEKVAEATRSTRRSCNLSLASPALGATTPSLRAASKQINVEINPVTPSAIPRVVVEASSPEPDLQKVEVLNPNKTPSLRSTEKDTIEVEMVTPIQSSRTPSLRSAKKQSVVAATSPEPMSDLEKVEALNPNKTPSLRSTEKDTMEVEMVTPIQSSRTPSLRSAKKQSVMAATSPEPMSDLEKVEVLNPNKTPSLRSAGEDTLKVEVVTPIQSSRTPSLRSAKKQSVMAATSPEPMSDLEKVEVLNPNKTPSLRSAGEDTLKVEVVTPIQSSRTPSLRSAKKQSVMAATSPEPMSDLEKVEVLNPNKTPSLRSAGEDTLKVEVVTPIQSSRTPSLRSAKKQSVMAATSPEPMSDLEKVEVLNPNKTPSLRSAGEDTLKVEVVTPIQSSRTPSLRSAKKQSVMAATSPEPMSDLEKVEVLNPNKTPSLRSAGEDTLKVEVVTPIQSSRTPSLRSAKKQSVMAATSPEPMSDLEKVEVLNPNKTPSLRSAGEDTLKVEVVTPIQSSRTPSLRSAKKQSTVAATSPEPMSDLEKVQALNPNKTPSLRSAGEDTLKVEVVTPIQSSRTPSLRSAKKQSTVAATSPEPMSDLEKVQALNPNKTPSLRSAEADTLEVEMVTPIQSSRTPSLRSAKKQSMVVDLLKVEPLNPSKMPSLRSTKTDTLNVVTPIQSSHTPSLRSAKKQSMVMVASPQPLLEVVEPLELMKTPSLRKPEDDVVSAQAMVTPVQPSCTPSLRSARMQSTVQSSASPEPTLEVVQAIEPSKTPSMRSTDQPKAVKQESIENSSIGGKSVGLTGLARLTKSPKENNAVENPADLFVPHMFRTPKLDKGGQNADVATKRADMESPNLVGLRKLMKTPKAPKLEADFEENFTAELFTTPVLKMAVSADEEATKPAGKAVRPKKQAAKKSDQVVIDLTSSPEVASTRRTRTSDSEALPKTSRAKRSAPEDSTAPAPKRTRRTRATVDQKQDSESEVSDPPVVKAPKGKKAARGKKTTQAAIETPKPFVFKRTQLESIAEVFSPLPRFEEALEGFTSAQLPVIAVLEKKASTIKGQVRSDPPKRLTRARPETESSQGEGSEQEVPAKSRSTRASNINSTKKTRGTSKVAVESGEAATKQSKEKPAPVTRATRSRKAEDAPVDDKTVPKELKTRATRSRRTQEPVVEEQAVEMPPVEKEVKKQTSKNSLHGKTTEVEDSGAVSAGTKTTRSKEVEIVTEETAPEPKSTRSTRGKQGSSKAVVKPKSARGKKAETEAVMEPKIEEQVESTESKPTRSLRKEAKVVEVPDLPRTTRRTRGNPVKEAAPVGNAAPTRKAGKAKADQEQNVEVVLPQNQLSGKRQPKVKEPEVEEPEVKAPKTTRSTRTKRIPQPTEATQNPPPKTRGTKRMLQEDSESATPEAKRTRSSARTQTANARQTRSRARK